MHDLPVNVQVKRCPTTSTLSYGDTQCHEVHFLACNDTQCHPIHRCQQYKSLCVTSHTACVMRRASCDSDYKTINAVGLPPTLSTPCYRRVSTPSLRPMTKPARLHNDIVIAIQVVTHPRITILRLPKQSPHQPAAHSVNTLSSPC